MYYMFARDFFMQKFSNFLIKVVTDASLTASVITTLERLRIIVLLAFLSILAIYFTVLEEEISFLSLLVVSSSAPNI